MHKTFVMKGDKFSIAKRLKSFTYAFNGLRLLIKEEHNAWIHLFATVCVVVAGILFKISSMEWVAVIFAIGLVFSFEIINSAVENLSDFVCSERNELIKKSEGPCCRCRSCLRHYCRCHRVDSFFP